MKDMGTEAYMPYRVGGLLYCPADNRTIAEKVIQGQINGLTSICFCLEDSISDERLAFAEACLKETLVKIANSKKRKESLPLLFVRVRSAEHLKKVYKENEGTMYALTGFVLPKFDLSNARAYMDEIAAIRAKGHFLYVMPTLESAAVADLGERHSRLTKIKEILDENKQCVLNVRVGGNDFAHLFGLRRNVTQNVYQMGVIQNILVDILNVFSRDYVVSGPVWEYFGTDEKDAWAIGLEKEMELDRLNGFVGKTAIHPSQLPVIKRGLQVEKADYEDAKAILGWDYSQGGVKKSAESNRMNEVKTHTKWAERIYILGNIYGVKGEEK